MKWERIERLFVSISFLACVIFSTGTFASADKLEIIRAAISKKGAKWTAGETSVSKLSDTEKKHRLGFKRPTETDLSAPEMEKTLSLDAPLTEVPASFDWRANGGYFVTPVKNQGSCGSCWAFATAAALESYNLIKDNTPGFDDNRAEEILLSCANAGSCSGGYISSASSYIRDTGLPPESYFPYTASSGDDSCSNALSGWQALTSRVDSWEYITTYSASVDPIKNALYTYGPLVTTFDVYNDFYSYKSGVYEYTTGSYLGGHAVLLVGYTDDASVDGGGYFIVKNSWGTSWGESGYFKIAYSQIDSPIYFGTWTIAFKQSSQSSIPTAPSSLTATAATSSQINLQWSDRSSNEEGFEIERCAGSGCSNFSLLATVSANTASYSNTGLTANTTYTYRVRAYNTSGDSSYSNTAAASTPAIQRTLTVSKSGTGSGTVTGTGVSCGSDCTEVYNDSTSVTLTATGNSGSGFASWAGCDVTNGNICTVIMSANKTVTATFTLNQYTLTATKTGTGSGTLTASGLSCNGSTCTGSYSYNTAVTITASANTGSNFTGWTGCDSTNGSTCTVTMTANKSVSAAFTLTQRTLTVSKSGTGEGSVTGTGISCGADCTEAYGYGTSVTLTATGNTGSSLTSWTGCDSTNGNTCTVTMTANKSVTASFTLGSYTLTATKTGTGSGTLTASGLSCNGNSCSGTYSYNTAVTITPTPDSYSSFSGWTGCDSTNGSTCTVTMTANKSVSANFTRNQHTLKVVKPGKGAGSVTASGISCGADCDGIYDEGATVILTATPEPGSVFGGWSGGGCSGTGACEVTIQNASIDVTATFNQVGALSIDTGTIGTQIAIAGSGFGDTKGRIFVGATATRIISWSDSSVVFEIRKPLIPGAYEVTVQPRVQKFYAAMGEGELFTMKGPENVSVTADVGLPGDQIEVKGNYFGSRKGKIFLEDQVSGFTKSCRVVSWSMDPTTGESTVIFAVPRIRGYVAGVSTSYSLKLINKIGVSIASTVFTIH